MENNILSSLVRRAVFKNIFSKLGTLVPVIT
jgi:hypothetical protein